MGHTLPMPSKKAVDLCAKSMIQGTPMAHRPSIRSSPAEIDEQQMRCVVPILDTTNPHFMRRRPDAWDDSLAIVESR